MRRRNVESTEPRSGERRVSGLVGAALVAVAAVAERPRLLCSPLSCVSRVNWGGAAESEAERSGSVGGGGTEAKSWTRVSWGEADITGRLESMYLRRKARG